MTAEASSVVLTGKDCTAQSRRSLRCWIDSRGPGEDLTQAVGFLLRALETGAEVTISTREPGMKLCNICRITLVPVGVHACHLCD